jgi:hypothetical protein
LWLLSITLSLHVFAFLCLQVDVALWLLSITLSLHVFALLCVQSGVALWLLFSTLSLHVFALLCLQADVAHLNCKLGAVRLEGAAGALAVLSPHSWLGSQEHQQKQQTNASQRHTLHVRSRAQNHAQHIPLTLVWKSQPREKMLHLVDGTQRFDEPGTNAPLNNASNTKRTANIPVSRTTVKFCGGVPMLTYTQIQTQQKPSPCVRTGP